MKIDIHKVTAIVAVIILVCAVIWWTKWQKREERPVHKRFDDSVNYHMNIAEEHAELAKQYMAQYEEYGRRYFAPDIDSAERAKLGAEIWANAIRKADSLRGSATR